MDAQLKQRVVGAAVLVVVGVVFIPIFLDQTGDEPVDSLSTARSSEPPSGFNSRVVPIDDAAVARIERAMDASPDELAQTAVGGAKTNRDAAMPAGAEPRAQDPAVQPRTGVTAWVVQLGSFGSEENATALVERLKKKDYIAFIEPFRDESKLAYRVRVGPELSKDIAQRIRAELAQEIDIDGIVMRYP